MNYSLSSTWGFWQVWIRVRFKSRKMTYQGLVCWFHGGSILLESNISFIFDMLILWIVVWIMDQWWLEPHKAKVTVIWKDSTRDTLAAFQKEAPPESIKTATWHTGILNENNCETPGAGAQKTYFEKLHIRLLTGWNGWQMLYSLWSLHSACPVTRSWTFMRFLLKNFRWHSAQTMPSWKLIRWVSND